LAIGPKKPGLRGLIACGLGITRSFRTLGSPQRTVGHSRTRAPRLPGNMPAGDPLFGDHDPRLRRSTPKSEPSTRFPVHQHNSTVGSALRGPPGASGDDAGPQPPKPPNTASDAALYARTQGHFRNMLETQRVMAPDGSVPPPAAGLHGPPPDGSFSAAVLRHRSPFDDRTLCVQTARRDHDRFRKRLGEPLDGPKNGADTL